MQPKASARAVSATTLGSVGDYILWYAKDRSKVKYRQLYLPKDPRATGGWGFNYCESQTGDRRPLTTEERKGTASALENLRLYTLDKLVSLGASSSHSARYNYYT